MAIPAAIGVWELGALAAGGLATVFLASPRAGRLLRKRPAPPPRHSQSCVPVPASDAGQRPEPISRDATQSCSNPGCREEMCPVCRQLPNPISGFTPAYVSGKREPKDWKTRPPLTSYKRTGRQYNGANIFVRPDKSRVYIDTSHTGKSAETEVFNHRGRHMDTICPHCVGCKQRTPPCREPLSLWENPSARPGVGRSWRPGVSSIAPPRRWSLPC